MPSDQLNFFSQKISGKGILKNQRIFDVERITNYEIRLSDSKSFKIDYTYRCLRCGFPLKEKMIHLKANGQNNMNRQEKCTICKRTKLFDSLLILSYILSGAIFILVFLGVVFKELAFDICLMIGCVEIIFLIFLGRLLEEALFIGLQKEEKVLAAFHRFALSGDLQAFDIALKFMKKLKIKKISSEFLITIFHVMLLQTDNLPYYWYYDLSNRLNLSKDELLSKLSNEIKKSENQDYLLNVLTKAPPSGFSTLLEILFHANNFSLMDLLYQRIDNLLVTKSYNNKWLQEFYINQNNYDRLFESVSKLETKQLIINLVESYSLVKIPAIDVIERGRQIVNAIPILRYIIRVLIYTLLAILIGYLYQLLD